MARWNDPEDWDGLRDGSRCPICLDEGPKDVVARLSTTWVTAPQVTPLPGYLCIVSKRHVVEPYELPPEERRAFWEESLSVAELLDKEFQPVKLNYEIHGNTIAHLHLHLFPRFRNDPFQNGPITLQDAKPRPAEEVMRINSMLRALHQVPS